MPDAFKFKVKNARVDHPPYLDDLQLTPGSPAAVTRPSLHDFPRPRCGPATIGLIGFGNRTAAISISALDLILALKDRG
jgi:hypothetical protein